MKTISNLLITNASASPGSGHAHGPEESGSTQMIGIGIIVVLRLQFFILCLKRNNILPGQLTLAGF